MYNSLILGLMSIMIFLVSYWCCKILDELEKMNGRVGKLNVERTIIRTIEDGTPEERQIIYKLYDLVEKYGLS